MKTLRFIEETFRNGKLIKSQTLFTWHDVTERLAKCICQNFYDGFLFNLKGSYRIPSVPYTMGYEILSYNFHKDKSGFVYRFVNGKNQTIKFKIK